MRKGRDGREKWKMKKKKEKKRLAFLVATTSLPAVYRLNGYAQMTTAGTPHARANEDKIKNEDHKTSVSLHPSEAIQDEE